LIRPAGEQDIGSIVRIWREGAAAAIGSAASSLPEAQLREFFLQRIRTIEAPFGFWVVCGADGVVIGWHALLPFDNNPVTSAFVAEWSIYVAQSSARQGIGEALTRHAMQAASDSTLQYVFGFISAENRAALAMVEKCGWVQVGAVPGTQKGPTRPGVVVVAFVPARINVPNLDDPVTNDPG
jgi:phosphinothricin acetyltransferase